jgi:tRNA pseudouridine13 synthase
VLGFEPDGEGEHVFLFIEKRGSNTADLALRLAAIAGLPASSVGFSGLKDRHAVTRQWFSVGLAGRPEPDWRALEDDQLRVLECRRHRRKLRRGVHRANRFTLRLRQLSGERAALERGLAAVKEQGVPNYFGEQRFGHRAVNLSRARWLLGEGRAPSRRQRSLQLSAVRAWLFNTLLADRVRRGNWACPAPGDVAMLAGSRSLFPCEEGYGELVERAASGDLHLALPLWGRGRFLESPDARSSMELVLADLVAWCRGLEEQGLKLDYRAARVLPDDFRWQFCEDGLELRFELGRGAYATALLRELVAYKDMTRNRSEAGGEQP